MKNLWQPICRFDYNKYMGGVDLADQFIGYYLTMHKAKNYFWRRVFEQKLMQACTNAWLLFTWWLKDMVDKVEAEIKILKDAGHVVGGNTAESVLLAKLKKLRSRARVQWLRALSRYLMAKCHEGCAARGGRRKRAGPAAFKMAKGRLEHYRLLPGETRPYCASPKSTGSLASRSGQVKRTRSARVSGGCFCESCKEVGGVPICRACHGHDDSHAAAYARVAQKKHKAARSTKRPLPEEESSEEE